MCVCVYKIRITEKDAMIGQEVIFEDVRQTLRFFSIEEDPESLNQK